MKQIKRSKRITKPSTAKEKKKTWTVFSKYIRLRDALATTGTKTHAKCVSCQREYPIEKLQAGHFIPGRGNAILFDEKCVHAQCMQDNILKKGDWVNYYNSMEKLYGREIIDELIARSKRPRKYTPNELSELRKEYLQKIKEMESL